MAASLDFDGSNDYIDLGDLTILDGTTEFTVMFHSNNNISSSGNQSILGRSSGGDNLGVLVRNTPQIFLSLNFNLGGTAYIKTAGLSSVDNNWYHYAWTWNSGISPQLLGGSNFYQNGLSVSLINHVAGGNLFTNFQNTAGNFQLGKRAGSTDTWNGQMSYIRIYNRALSQSEVQDSVYKPEAIVKGLVGYWPLWTTAVKDLSGNGNDGTISGTVVESSAGPPVYFPDLQTN